MPEPPKSEPRRVPLLARFGPALLGGMTLGDWLRLLHQSRYQVDLPYWPRLASITAATASNSLWRFWENLRHGRRIRAAEIEPPLFVLGIWRSGTTHLHNLLARDARFAFPNTYQVNNPHTFLSTEAFQARIMQMLLPTVRPQDNVKFGVAEPQEDEFALMALTGMSFMMSMALPRCREHFDRYLTFEGVPADDVARWKEALAWFVRKVSYKYGRPLVLKSPGHTARIKLLLEVFPDARFVHIHRHPYDVFRSSLHTVEKLNPWLALQRPEVSDLAQAVLDRHCELFEAFFEQRDLIPPGRFHELAYADLERDPLGQMRMLYEALGLPDFAQVEPALREYIASLGGYQKNTLAELPPELKQQLAARCRRCFEEWGYEE